MKIFGNEVYNYGKESAANQFHHLYYLSNRSGTPAEAYEIAWNYHHDNYAYQGIHVYDQSPCGGWSGAIKIHHNVVKNQSGAAINLNVNCPEALEFEVHDNLLITDYDFRPDTSTTVYCGVGAPFRYTIQNTISHAKFYNNTVYGYGESTIINTAGADFRNNLIVDNRNRNYFGLYNAYDTNTNNLFYSFSDPALTTPAESLNSINLDPLFTDMSSQDLSLQLASPALGAGDNSVLSAAPREFRGGLRLNGQVSIGAIEHYVAAINPVAPVQEKALAYPVPFVAGRDANITFTNILPPAVFEIYSIEGSLIYSCNLNAVRYDYDPKSLASGVYQYVIKDSLNTKNGKIVIIK
jgi:hypothetical protein